MRYLKGPSGERNSLNGLTWFKGMALVVALTLFAPPLATADEPPVAHVSIGTDGITFDPVQDFQSLVVSVASGDVHVTRTFDGSAPAHFEIFDDDGFVFPDGGYKYEVTPIMLGAATRERNSDSAASRVERIQWGSFRIDGGWLVDPGVSESGGSD